ncbi:MAG TPA: PH domain-containing protein [Galbitalea sp.]|jgi:putative membrane protein|nr:PH domain-containing protein [Galbitalea sp.]
MSEAAPAAPDADDLPDTSEEPWNRLDPRMLLVHPLRELIRYLPVILVALIAGSVGGEPWWWYALSGLGVVIGVLRWFTTSYRITPTHVQIRRGILNRRLLSVPRDRIRSVDVDSTILHRIFGLSVVKVGTGASHGVEDLEFNAMRSGDVPAFRAEMLSHVSRSALRAPTQDEQDEVALEKSGRNFSRWRPSWVRYAPFTLSGVASIVVVVVFVLQTQFFDNGVLTRLPIVRDTLSRIEHLPTLTLALWGIGILVVAASIVAAVRYLLSYSHFTISRMDASTLHITHGLLRVRQITIDERRLRGVQLFEPLSLRAVGAAATHAIMTGLGRQRGGVALLSPPGPRAEALRISEDVLEISSPLKCELVQHGPRARRRRYTRATVFAVVLAIIAGGLQLLGTVGPTVWWAFAFILPASAFLAWDRYRGLGHALLPGWLVARSGSLNRRRVVLATEGIIGWDIRRSFFQRRAGLATLIATTAAGRHRYDIPDIPFEDAWRIVEGVNDQAVQKAASR